MTKYEQSNSAAVHFSIPVWCLLRPFAGGEMFVQQVVSLVGILAGKLGAEARPGDAAAHNDGAAQCSPSASTT
ncbi:MAG TPA: hypothetical protein PLI59_08005, partial [Candidatus Obscuribacter sp.]|nr:hypothetical protein [Candidatus Obscuribacter sp.]